MDSLWKIYYGDGSVVSGNKKGDWISAPDNGVQVIVVNRQPNPSMIYDRFITGYVGCDRLKPNVTFYTGIDEYDPLNYGKPKFGSLLPDNQYKLIWENAYGNN